MSGLSPTIRSANPYYLPQPVELVADNGRILRNTANMRIYPFWCESSIVAIDVDFFINVGSEEHYSGKYHIVFLDDAEAFLDLGFLLPSGTYFEADGRFELDDEDPDTLEITLMIKLEGVSIDPATSLFRVKMAEVIGTYIADDD